MITQYNHSISSFVGDAGYIYSVSFHAEKAKFKKVERRPNNQKIEIAILRKENPKPTS